MNGVTTFFLSVCDPSDVNVVQGYCELSIHFITGKLYFIYVFSGGSLQDHIETCRTLTIPLALTYFKQLLEGLMYFQEKYVLHEDIKSDNILLRSGTTQLVFVDFGLTRQLPPDNPYVPEGKRLFTVNIVYLGEGHSLSWGGSIIVLFSGRAGLKIHERITEFQSHIKGDNKI